MSRRFAILLVPCLLPFCPGAPLPVWAAWPCFLVLLVLLLLLFLLLFPILP